MRINPLCSYEQWKACRWGIDWRLIADAVLWDRYSCVVEVGVGPLEISILPFFEDMYGRKVGLEAHPVLAQKAATALKLTEIVNAALWTSSGETIQLEDNGGSSGVVGQWKPTPGGAARVEAPTISWRDFFEQYIHPYSLEILNLDCEGCEHLALEGMSDYAPEELPRLLGIELWPQYPKAAWCEQWMLDRHYVPVLATGPQSETQIWRRTRA